ncbi:Man1-Src1p-C-terminal domain-containing protein [Phanerochaete sordida]|uniref:Man1-Src1p-C-terminal domain-containing protein n=1 Tax=Phanerochaete sordida TaxID=48140 RepID=A0A9P3GHZ0_9APHY|nr:Man1-Src1p-C-terminal domain-containing protein [Phanerochaete sordida]
MSRSLTSAQIIEQGEYLEPDFDAHSLTIAQLLGIFGFHGIMYPTPYTKPKLVAVFDEEIKTRADQFKHERLSRQNSQASDDGITDGLTGRPLNEERKRTTRAASRRASVAPKDQNEPVAEPAKPEPAKRRRASAEPSVGRATSRRRAAKAPEPTTVAEESEPDEPPVKKVSRKKTANTEAATQSRVAAARPRDDVDSGWEDNNIFQSGAESASPSPVKPRTRKSSAIPTRSKKSMSVPPQFAPPPSPPKESPSRIPRRRATAVKPPESEFEPELPETVFQDSKATTSRARLATPEVVITSRRAAATDNLEEAKVEVQTEQAVFGGAPSPHALPRFSPKASPKSSPRKSQPPSPRELVDTVAGEETEQALSVIEEQTEKSDSQALSQVQSDESQQLVSSQDETSHEVTRPRPRGRGWGPSFGNFMLALLGSGALTTVWMYKAESSSIGFCETGRNTNDVLEGLKIRRAAVEECNRENRTTLFSINPDTAQTVPSPTPTQVVGSEGSEVVLSEACPAPPFVPLPQPETCQPCPDHATCTPATITCENGYLLRPHPLLAFLSIPSSLRPTDNQNAYINPSLAVAPTLGNRGPLDLAYTGLSLLMDGLPGMGPVAFPPRCVEDPKRKRHIGALGKAIESILAAERGRRLCAGVRPADKPISSSGEAKKWGVELNALKEVLKKDAAKKKNSAQLLSTLEDTFNEAIQQLVEWGGVFVGEDEKGHRYIAHRTPKLDMLCTVKVKAMASWSEYWKQIIGTLAAILATQMAKHRRRQRLEDRERVTVLVDTVYDMLRNQELAHQTDPLSAPRPYIPSTQLRDAVLQGEHALATRQRLWTAVERVVEANTNVRTNLEEVPGGDEMRVWRWVGAVGQTLPYELRAESLPASPATPA